MKSSEVSIKSRSTTASPTIQGQVTKDTTVKWSINYFEFLHVGACALEVQVMHGDPGFKYLGFIAFRPVSTEFGAGEVKVSPCPRPLVAVAASSINFGTLGAPFASAVAVSSHNLVFP